MANFKRQTTRINHRPLVLARSPLNSTKPSCQSFGKRIGTSLVILQMGSVIAPVVIVMALNIQSRLTAFVGVVQDLYHSSFSQSFSPSLITERGLGGEPGKRNEWD